MRALQRAALEPRAARTLAVEVSERARARGDWPVVSTAERALGVAAMNLNDIDAALDHLRAAVMAGRRGRCRSREGEARMSLASALVLSGRPTQAAREIEAALHDLEGVAAARAGVQRAAILQELGRDDAALEQLRSSLPVLRRAGDVEWAVRALSNRSLIHTGRRSFGAAETDLRDALQLCVQHDLELPAAYAEQNLGCVKAKRGDVPAALRSFADAEERYHRFGLVEASLLVDRAEVLLSVRLLEEAREAAEAAVRAYERQRRDVHVPEAHLLLSTVALLQGDTVTADASAAAAIHGFRRVGRDKSLSLAQYARIQASVAADARRVSCAQAARAADRLAEAGWQVPALEARILAGRMALEQGHRRTAQRHLALASRARHAGPADVRARAWLAEALLRRANGRRAAALSALRAGLRIVEDHQATLGATELRAHVSVHRGELARSGLRLALESGSARRVLWWAERGRTSAPWFRPARPPDDPQLARDLADLRSTMAEIDEARDEGRPDDSLLQRQVRLERRIRDRCRTLGSTGAGHGRSTELADMLAPLREAVLVSYLEVGGDLQVVTVTDGRCRLHRLGPSAPIRQWLAHAGFALRRLTRPHPGTPDGGPAAVAVLRRAAGVLDDHLLRPLRAAVDDRPLVVVPTGTLRSVPWSILPTCHGRPVTVAPSVRTWFQAVSRSQPSTDDAVVVVAGPGLPGAAAEASEVARLYRGSRLLMGAAATAGDVSSAMDGAAMLHLAAHGTVRSDNPLFSSVTLADGPFTVYELERLEQAPHHVVLAACDTARPQVVAGEELLGFGTALLAGGTATLVAPLVPVADAATVTLMCAYHEALRRGRSPAAALATAQRSLDPDAPAVIATGAAFVCVGAG
ncbi:tetratricopeptide (TPR) repeat protein [Geodermatophilus bullaregiensis]|uniref:CHAT domain-containing protein n=1 Tax=Geodermatophilus bullaregiensis TaxID=1564160 RepID=UPI0019599563|nr:CHAT domain-containing protein [Geodermatophilus bullaregiensis]MBM7805110.1 tetratricopeptide (TPR) repeat protein [Geodermatophilus bullaregiensis]